MDWLHQILHGPDQSGISFEHWVKHLLASRRDTRVVAISADQGGDLGCDLLEPETGTVIQVYCPSSNGYAESSVERRILAKMRADLAKIRRHAPAIERMLGHPIARWQLVVPVDPTPRLAEAAQAAGKRHGIVIEILGRAHLAATIVALGFDPTSGAWLRARFSAGRLKDDPIHTGNLRLSDLYVRPLVKRKRAGTLEEQESVDFSACLLHALSSGAMAQQPWIVLGDYGSGKSSLLKTVASAVASDPTLPVPLWVPLREAVLGETRSLKDWLNEYLISKHGIVSDPVEFVRRPKLWLLDGFDELNLQLRENSERIELLVKEIAQLAATPGNHVILSSRPILFMEREHQLPSDSPVFRLHGFDAAGVSEWIEKWCAVPAHRSTPLSVQALRERGLLREAENPLVLHMIAQLIGDELSENRPFLRAEIFQRFIDATVGGKFAAPLGQGPHRLPRNFRPLLRRVARTVHCSADGTFATMEEIRTCLGSALTDREFAALAKNPQFLLVGHFFRERQPRRKSGQSPTARWIEFCHLSFKEFLLVEYLLNALVGVPDAALPIRDLLEISFRSLSDAELGFLEESICLLPGDARLRLFQKLRYVTVAETGLEEEVAKQLPTDPELAPLVAYLPYRKLTLRTLFFFVRSVIASRASDEFARKLSSGERASQCMGQLLQSDSTGHDQVDLKKFLKRVLGRLPGGILAQGARYRSAELNFDSLREWALIRPQSSGGLNLIGRKWSNGILDTLKPPTRVFWGVNTSVRSLFCGGELLLDAAGCQFVECVFFDVIIRLPPRAATAETQPFQFSNCTFVDSHIIPDQAGSSTTDTSQPHLAHCREFATEKDRRARDLRRRILRAVCQLDASTKQNPAATMRPWGELVFADQSDFERKVLYPSERPQSSIAFLRAHDWSVARAGEK